VITWENRWQNGKRNISGGIWDIGEDRKPLSLTGIPWLFLTGPHSGLKSRSGWDLTASCSTCIPSPAVRFVSGLPWKFPHCTSHTVIHGFYIHGHTAQLQGELVLIHDSGHGDEVLEVCVVVSASGGTYVPIHSSPFANCWQFWIQK
jgi:hypothetical protein